MGAMSDTGYQKGDALGKTCFKTGEKAADPVLGGLEVLMFRKHLWRDESPVALCRRCGKSRRKVKEQKS